MDMLTPVVERLRNTTDRDIRQLAQVTGLAWPTITKIKYGQTKNPGVTTVQRLYDFLIEFKVPQKLPPQK